MPSSTCADEHNVCLQLKQLIRQYPQASNFLDNHSLDGFWIWNLKSQREEWLSPGFWHCLGYSPDVYHRIRPNWQKVIFPEDLRGFTRHFAALINKDCEDFQRISRFCAKDGSTVWLESNGLLIRDIDDNPEQFIITHQNISEFKQTEQQLKSVNERFDLAVAGSSSAIWDWHDVKQSAAYWSPRLYELLGYKNLDFPSTLENFMRLVHPDDVDRLRVCLNNHLYRSEPCDLEYRLRTKDGGFRWFRGTGAASRDAIGNPLRMAGSLTDIHERKTNEIKLRHTLLQLEQSNKELEEFAYTAAHDLKEPLRTLQTFSDYFIQDMESGNTERANQDKQFIDQACRRMRSLVDGLLDMSRVGSHGLKFGKHQLLDIVNTVIEQLQHAIKDTGARVEVAGNLPELYVDSSQFSLAIQNIVQNALKFHRQDIPPLVTISARDTAEESIISITDNGIGIDEEQKHTIFGLFKRLHRENEYTGTGIGLAVVAKIITRHNGKVTVENAKDGFGTTFSLHLPRSSSKNKENIEMSEAVSCSEPR